MKRKNWTERRRTVAVLDPVSLTQQDHKTNAIDLLRDYARGVPVPGRNSIPQFGIDDTNMDRATLERLRVDAKDLEQAVKAEQEKAKNDELKRQKTPKTNQQQQPTVPTPPPSPTTGASEPSSQKQPGTPQGT